MTNSCKQEQGDVVYIREMTSEFCCLRRKSRVSRNISFFASPGQLHEGGERHNRVSPRRCSTLQFVVEHCTCSNLLNGAKRSAERGSTRHCEIRQMTRTAEVNTAQCARSRRLNYQTNTPPSLQHEHSSRPPPEVRLI